MGKNRYEVEYENSESCFWEKSPAKYVKLFCSKYVTDLENLKVLDLGAGEGKNSVFLASQGAYVTAVDISTIALSRFSLQPNYIQCKKKINSIKGDVRTIDFDNNQFDLIVAYGIFHALDDVQEIYSLI
jgi:2-polyprenyl-3-methyl-5-hydroxy-6-metoxy-1,4-benzoquinol methylase